MIKLTCLFAFLLLSCTGPKKVQQEDEFQDSLCKVFLEFENELSTKSDNIDSNVFKKLLNIRIIDSVINAPGFQNLYFNPVVSDTLFTDKTFNYPATKKVSNESDQAVISTKSKIFYCGKIKWGDLRIIKRLKKIKHGSSNKLNTLEAI